MIRRAQWKTRRTKDGVAISLRPHPKPCVITYDVFETGCRYLGIDPEAVMSGTLEVRELAQPSPADAQAFLHAVLKNAHVYRIQEWPLDRLRAVLALVAADFLRASVASWVRPGPSEAS